MLSRLFVPLASCVLLVILPYRLLPPLHAGTEGPREIAFLTLQISDDGVRLLEWNTVRGTLKTERSPTASQGITCAAVSAAGVPVWESTIADPRVRRMEFADDDSASGMTGFVVVADSATFTIRVPALAGIGHLEFSAPPKSSGASITSAAAKEPIGSIEWPGTRQGSLK